MISLFSGTIHFMKRYLEKWIYIIFFLALLLRIYKLGDFPIGFHVDEVKVGWNALSIATTLKDDKNEILPIYYNTFGDHRLTGIFYISIPSIILFDNTIFAVRFTSALFGALSVFPVYLITRMLMKNRKKVGVIAGLILAVSPWHIAASRATSEVVISSFFVLFSIYFFMKLIEDQNKKFIYLTLLSTIASYFLYHSARILIPLYLITTYLLLAKKFNKLLLIPIIFSLILTTVLTFNKSATERFKQVSIFKNEDVQYELERSGENKILVYSRNIIEEYGKYFSSDFLIGEAAKPYRYITPGVGLLNYIDILLLLTGVYFIIRKKNPIILILFLLISPLPAILTVEDSPNLHRSFYMMPIIAIIESIGFYYIKNKKIALSVIFVGLFYFFYSYLFRSELRFPYQKYIYRDSPTYRNIGNVELSKKINEYAKNYDLIYITNFPDNLYSWYAYLNDLDPKEFNEKSYIENSNERRYMNIIFSDTKCPSDHAFETTAKILVIDAAECNTEVKIKDGMKAKIIEVVKRSDNSDVYFVSSSI